MKFSFEFDAPKYKCFGGNQPRRSTITAIDQNSAYDRWFLTFKEGNTWQHELRQFQLNNPQSQEVEKEHENAINNANNNALEQKNTHHNSIKNLKNTSIKSYPVSNKISQDKSITQSKSISLNKSLSLKTQNHSRKQIPSIKKNIIHSNQIPNEQNINISKPKTKKPMESIRQFPIKRQIPFQKQKLTQNLSQIPSNKTSNEMKRSLRSLDSKPPNKIQSKMKQTKILIPKQIKKSKSQPKIAPIKNQRQKNRKPPCLYPIRIQRQWEQHHSKKWYELSSQEINQAQKSMKKRMNNKSSIMSSLNQPNNESKKYQRVTRIKQNHLNHENVVKQSVRNPLYKHPNKKKSNDNIQI